MAHHRMLVLADDMTGALEVGSKFAAAGVESLVRSAPVLSSSDLQESVGVLVVDSETRHLAAGEAHRRIAELARAARAAGFTGVYKKTDSTLRGNIGAELAALLEAYPGSALLYVPTYPQMGRTVKNGTLLVEGVPVGQTCFAADSLNPVTESHIPTLLASQCSLTMRSGAITDLTVLEAGSLAICDGETDLDLQAAAVEFVNSSTFQLAAGPAGFATQLARVLDLPRCPPPTLPRVHHALVVHGSRHPISIEQVEHAKRHGFGSVAGTASSAPGTLDGWNILEGDSTLEIASLEFAKKTAHSVWRLLSREAIDLLVIFGGDTAYAIVEAAGNPPLHPLGEVMEGIPISRIAARDIETSNGRRDRDLYAITKAGGFGPPDVLASIRTRIGER